MTRMVTFEERVWTITAMPRVERGVSTGDEHVALSISGLRFLSNKGEAPAGRPRFDAVPSLREYLIPGHSLPRLLPGRGVDHLELHPLVRHGEV